VERLAVLLDQALRPPFLFDAVSAEVAGLADQPAVVAAVIFARLFQVYSREANDLGQWLFALYVAGAVTAATRAGTHLAVDTLARRYPRWLRGSWRTVAMWWRSGRGRSSSLPPARRWLPSIAHWERFPDPGNPRILHPQGIALAHGRRRSRQHRPRAVAR
jgi:hypothetical protein